MPRLLYLFQCVPLLYSTNWLKSFQSESTKFIWQDHPPRLKAAILHKKNSEGGLALPDCARYLKAAALARIIDWSHHLDSKDWVEIEQQATHLIHLPWFDKIHRRILHNSHPLLKSTLNTWDRVSGKTQISAYPSPLIPVTNNPAFPSALKPTAFREWLVDGHLQIAHIMEQGQLADLNLLRRARPTVNLQDYQYCQFKHFLGYLGGANKLGQPLTPFETLCTRETPLNI